MPSGKHLTGQQVAQIRHLRGQGFTQAEVAEAVQCSRQAVARIAAGRLGKVENYRLREAFVASGREAADVAREMGWLTTRGADTSRVRRTLGILNDRGNGCVGLRRLIDHGTAVELARAIGVGPWEVGL